MARTPLREAVYASIADLLRAGLTDVEGLAVERNRRSLLNDGEAPRLVLRDGAQQPDPDAVGEDLIRLDASLEGYVDGDDDTIGAAISDLYARAAEILFTDEGLVLATTLDALPVQVFLAEGRMEIDILTVTESEAVMGSFYLDLTVDVRVPFGTRFLQNP